MTRVRVNHRTAAGREDNHRVERNASVTDKRFIFFFSSLRFNFIDRWQPIGGEPLASAVERARVRFCKSGIKRRTVDAGRGETRVRTHDRRPGNLCERDR